MTTYWQVDPTEIWSGQPSYSLGLKLYDQDVDNYQSVCATWDFPVSNTAGNDAWEDVVTIAILFPGFVAAGDYLRVGFRANGGGTGGATGDEDQVRLKDETSASTGTAVEVITEPQIVALDIVCGDWADTVRYITIQGWDDSTSGVQLDVWNEANALNVYWWT